MTDNERENTSGEAARAKKRRKEMHIVRGEGMGDVQWGLSLSGGGIRSATFCLGVLQGLSKAPGPQALAPGAAPACPPLPEPSLLPQFDYVSTVSGGGYIGGFFGSLFVPNRLHTAGGLSDKDTADQAYEVFRYEPPGRLRGDVAIDAVPQVMGQKLPQPGQAPLAWLRENGRYMAPTGSSDLIYDVALAIRAWFGMQCVLGTVLLTLLAMMAWVGATVRYLALKHAWPWLPPYLRYEWGLLKGARHADYHIWWSPGWFLLLLLVLLWLAPCSTAFWLTHPDDEGTVADKPKANWACVGTLLMGVLLALVALVDVEMHGNTGPLLALCGGAIVTCLSVVWFDLTGRKAASIAAQRVVLTRALGNGLVVGAIIVASRAGGHAGALAVSGGGAALGQHFRRGHAAGPRSAPSGADGRQAGQAVFAPAPVDGHRGGDRGPAAVAGGGGVLAHGGAVVRVAGRQSGDLPRSGAPGRGLVDAERAGGGGLRRVRTPSRLPQPVQL